MLNIQVLSESLDLDLITEIKSYIRTNDSCRTNYTTWDARLIRNSSPILIFQIAGELREKLLKNIENKFPFLSEYKDISVSYTYYPVGSYIPWHSDASYKYAITIYMNEVWDRDWGGYLVYDCNGLKVEVPRFNKLVLMQTPIEHCVTCINVGSPVRETIQLFIN